MKADAEFGQKMLANEKRKKLTKVEKEIVELINPNYCGNKKPHICNKFHDEIKPKRVKKCNNMNEFIDDKYGRRSSLKTCIKPFGHKGKHEAKIRW